MTDQSQWRILVVEDDIDGQEVVATILSRLNIPVDVAGNAQEASAFLAGSPDNYGAAIIDLALPGKDGWTLLKEIQSSPATRALPCVAVTGFHTSKMREETLRAGFVGYYPKPLDPMALLRGLESILAR